MTLLLLLLGKCLNKNYSIGCVEIRNTAFKGPGVSVSVVQMLLNGSDKNRMHLTQIIIRYLL